MHCDASSLAALLDADLTAGGWNGTLVPYPGQPSSQFAMMALSKSFLKKFHNKEKSADRDRKALDLFLKVNESCANYQLADPPTTLMAVALGEARDFTHKFCYRFLPDEGVDELILSLGKIEREVGFGKGANIGARSGDPYGKLAISNLTYTDPALLVLFQHTNTLRGLWDEQEQFRSQRYPSTLVQGSKLSFVPKSREITRTICTEPILNMFFQKGIAALLEGRLDEVVGIDLSKQQPKNRELARRGSITGEFGTIDLSSASDSMSMSLVRRWFPPCFVAWLELCRSKVTVLKDGNVIDLHMVSSMGNAYTFPLQTLFFTSLVVGAYKAMDIKIQKPWGDTVGNFAVFGDDIIVKREAYNLVVAMLTHCGFTVNGDKSFNEGLFRESCGADWFNGTNVRGVYLQKLLDNQDCYSAFNRLAHWGARHEVNLSRSLEYLKTGATKHLHVPLHEDDEAGFKIPLALIRQKLRTYRKYRSSGCYGYIRAVRRRCFVKLPYSESEVTPAFLRRIRRRIPYWNYNPAGLLLLLLHGNVRDGRLLLRSSDEGAAEYLKAHSSCWDYVPSAVSERHGFEEAYHRLLSYAWFA